MLQIDKFTSAYLTCALWSSTDDDDKPLDDTYSIRDIADESLASAVADCTAFQRDNAEDLATYPAYRRGKDGEEYTGAELAGHDLWLTRNGHGTGFWDRDYLTEDVRERLTQAAHKLGEAYAYVGDNSKVHFS